MKKYRKVSIKKLPNQLVSQNMVSFESVLFFHILFFVFILIHQRCQYKPESIAQQCLTNSANKKRFQKYELYFLRIF